MKLQKEFSFMTNELKKKLLLFYLEQVHKPLNKFKQSELRLLDNRADLRNQIVSGEDLNRKEVKDIVHDIWGCNADEQG